MSRVLFVLGYYTRMYDILYVSDMILKLRIFKFSFWMSLTIPIYISKIELMAYYIFIYKISGRNFIYYNIDTNYIMKYQINAVRLSYNI